MSEFSLEQDAVDWLLDHFAGLDALGHLRARRRGRVVTVESGPKGDAVSHVRFRRDTVHLWLLEMPGKAGRWDRTPYRDRIENLMALVEKQFPWTLTDLEDFGAGRSAGPDAPH